jgi:predicted dehydrogenase
VLQDLGSHVVDICLWYFGSLDIENATLRSIKNSISEDEAKLEVRGNASLKGFFDISWCKREYRMPEFGVKVQGEEGEIVVNDDEIMLRRKKGKRVIWYRHDLNDSVGFLIGAPEYYREDEYFVNSALAGQQVKPDFSDAARVDSLLERVKMEATWK